MATLRFRYLLLATLQFRSLLLPTFQFRWLLLATLQPPFSAPKRRKEQHREMKRRQQQLQGMKCRQQQLLAASDPERGVSQASGSIDMSRTCPNEPKSPRSGIWRQTDMSFTCQSGSKTQTLPAAPARNNGYVRTNAPVTFAPPGWLSRADKRPRHLCPRERTRERTTTLLALVLRASLFVGDHGSTEGGKAGTR